MGFRVRDLLIRQRTQTFSALRGHLTEFGEVVPLVAANGAGLIATIDLFDSPHAALAAPAIIRAVPLALSVRHKQSTSNLFILCDQDSQQARQLVGKSDGNQHSRRAGKNATES